MFGLITGSGLYNFPDLTDRRVERVPNPYGEPVAVTVGRVNGHELCFLPRHGSDHSVPPHAINYRANIIGLREVGADAILATAVVGSIEPAWGEGTMAVVTDYINLTSGRHDTFFDGSPGALAFASSPVVHTDMSDPYHPGLRQALLTAADELGQGLEPAAVYCCADGPRFETKAEIEMMARLGGQVVGMTGYPEVALAVEAGLPYASLALVSNHAAGVGQKPVSVAAIVEALERRAPDVYSMVARTVDVFRR
jgi:5'-methylthioadenosine phosphorylase